MLKPCFKPICCRCAVKSPQVRFEYIARGGTLQISRRHVRSRTSSVYLRRTEVINLKMGSPCNTSGCASQLFGQNKDCDEYRALSKIAESLTHPRRTLLNVFVQHAVYPEIASRFFLREVSGQDKIAVSGFLADWTCLLTKGILLTTEWNTR